MRIGFFHELPRDKVTNFFQVIRKKRLKRICTWWDSNLAFIRSKTCPQDRVKESVLITKPSRPPRQ